VSAPVSEWVSELKASGFEGALLEHELLSRHTSYRIGGPADCVVCPKNSTDLKHLARVLKRHGVPYAILGAGSNVLAPDEPIQGCVIKLSRFDSRIESFSSRSTDLSDALLIEVGTGAQISSLLREAITHGWSGLECLAGIPGSLGGVVAMNGGTHLGELAGICERFELFSLASGEARTVEAGEFEFSYRKNAAIRAHEIVTRVVLRVSVESTERVRIRLEELLARRKATQPLEHPSCGSVFKNPDGSLKAWEIIEKIGMRGAIEGSAQISIKHPNWIVNLGGAKASDVTALILRAKERALQVLGVELESELRPLFLSRSD
jgi:UDP-N-acetylmuramate dehydrogenase